MEGLVGLQGLVSQQRDDLAGQRQVPLLGRGRPLWLGE